MEASKQEKSDWTMKHQVECKQCLCLVPEDWIDDKEKGICYLCTPMTAEDWKLVSDKKPLPL